MLKHIKELQISDRYHLKFRFELGPDLARSPNFRHGPESGPARGPKIEFRQGPARPDF